MYVEGARATEKLVENVLGGRIPNDYALALIGPNETLTTTQQKDRRLITLATYHNEENVMRIVDLKRESDTMNTQVHGVISLPSPDDRFGKWLSRVLCRSDPIGDTIPRDTGGGVRDRPIARSLFWS